MHREARPSKDTGRRSPSASGTERSREKPNLQTS